MYCSATNFVRTLVVEITERDLKICGEIPDGVLVLGGTSHCTGVVKSGMPVTG